MQDDSNNLKAEDLASTTAGVFGRGVCFIELKTGGYETWTTNEYTYRDPMVVLEWTKSVAVHKKRVSQSFLRKFVLKKIERCHIRIVKFQTSKKFRIFVRPVNMLKLFVFGTVCHP